MVMDAKQIELNRITDMIKTRGYAVVSSSIQGQMVVVSVEKIMPAELQASRDLEASWMRNFVKSFGWEVQKMSFPEGKITLEFSKTVQVQAAG